jgi:predicted kinase
MSLQTLYILTGLPYAGKSTLRKRLIDRYGLSYVSVDELIDRRNLDTEVMTQDDWNSVYSETLEGLKYRLANGENVIVDIGNLKRSERDAVRSIGAEYSVDPKLIYINTTKEEILNRRSRNEETQERGQLTESLLNRAFDMFEEPQADESPIIYNQEIDLDEWLQVNIEGQPASPEGRSEKSFQ